MTVAGSLAWGSRVLKRRGIAGHHKDIEFLLAELVGRDLAWIRLNRGRLLPSRTLDAFKELIFLRASGTPTQYLVGATEFFGLEIKVSRGVYIPKQETELLVEEALQFLETPRRADLTWGKSPMPARIHEVGTGSGAIAISIAKHAPRADIAASDVSAFALSLARQNSDRNGVAGQIRFFIGDLQEPLPGSPELVVANLPYIREQEEGRLPREVRAQPRTSLLSQDSGLDHIKRLLKNLILKPGGRVMLEIGFDQAQRREVSLCRQCEPAIRAHVKGLGGARPHRSDRGYVNP